MNKIAKLFVTFISAITLALVSFTSSFAKVDGEYIVLGSAISLTGNTLLMEFILKMVITWPLTELTKWVE